MYEENVSGFAKADRIVMKILRTISYFGGVFLVGIMLVAFVNVVGSKFFHTSIGGSTEMIEYMHVPVVFLAVAYVTLDNGHTKVDLLSKHFPKALQRIMEIVGDVLAVVVTAYVGICGISRVTDYYTHGSMSSTSGVRFPLWPVAVIFVFGVFELSFSFIWKLLRSFFLKLPESKPELHNGDIPSKDEKFMEIQKDYDAKMEERLGLNKDKDAGEEGGDAK